MISNKHFLHFTMIVESKNNTNLSIIIRDFDYFDEIITIF